MKTRRRVQSGATRPAVFHRNSTCIEYSMGETDFIVENVFSPTTVRNIQEQAARRKAYLDDQKIPAVYKLSPSYYFRDQIARCSQIADSGTMYSDEVVEYVVEAVRQFGVDALRLNASDKFRIHPLSNEEITARAAQLNKDAMEFFSGMPLPKNPARPTLVISLNKLNQMKESSREPEDSALAPWDLEEHPEVQPAEERRSPQDYLHPSARAQEEAELFELRYREGLGPAICDVLRFWRKQVERGPLKERRLAAKHLREIGKALIPETRGKRGNTLQASHYEVTKFYLKELYRVYHIDKALRSPSGPRNHSLRVKEAGENYGLSVKLMREFWGLDEDDKPNRQPLRLKDIARELTARNFRITHQTVSNILSS